MIWNKPLFEQNSLNDKVITEFDKLETCSKTLQEDQLFQQPAKIMEEITMDKPEIVPLKEIGI